MALSPPIEQTPDEVRRLLDPLRNDLSVAIHNHGNPFSVGGIIRVAHSFLVREIFIIGNSPYYQKASMGMHRYETIRTVDHEEQFLSQTNGRPLWAVEKDFATKSLFEVDQFPAGVVLVFGSERSGLPKSIIQAAQDVIGIPMFGINHSFPVGVAVGMVLCMWAKLHYKPGTIVTGPNR